MKKAAALVLLVTISLGLASCSKAPAASSAAPPTLPDIVCYPDFPGVPDYGALCGYEQYTRAQYDGLTLYAYEAKEPGHAGETNFKNNFAAYVDAAAALGYATDEYLWEDDLVGRVSCGGSLAYISRVTGEYNGGVTTLIIVAIGPPEAFAAYGPSPSPETT